MTIQTSQGHIQFHLIQEDGLLPRTEPLHIGDKQRFERLSEDEQWSMRKEARTELERDIVKWWE